MIEPYYRHTTYEDGILCYDFAAPNIISKQRVPVKVEGATWVEIHPSVNETPMP